MNRILWICTAVALLVSLISSRQKTLAALLVAAVVALVFGEVSLLW